MRFPSRNVASALITFLFAAGVATSAVPRGRTLEPSAAEATLRALSGRHPRNLHYLFRPLRSSERLRERSREGGADFAAAAPARRSVAGSLQPQAWWTGHVSFTRRSSSQRRPSHGSGQG